MWPEGGHGEVLGLPAEHRRELRKQRLVVSGHRSILPDPGGWPGEVGARFWSSSGRPSVGGGRLSAASPGRVVASESFTTVTVRRFGLSWTAGLLRRLVLKRTASLPVRARAWLRDEHVLWQPVEEGCSLSRPVQAAWR